MPPPCIDAVRRLVGGPWCTAAAYERVATPGARTPQHPPPTQRLGRGRVGEQVLRTTLAGYDEMIGLDLDDLSVDESITKSACGGEVAGRSRSTGASKARTGPWPATTRASR